MGRVVSEILSFAGVLRGFRPLTVSSRQTGRPGNTALSVMSTDLIRGRAWRFHGGFTARSRGPHEISGNFRPRELHGRGEAQQKKNWYRASTGFALARGLPAPAGPRRSDLQHGGSISGLADNKLVDGLAPECPPASLGVVLVNIGSYFDQRVRLEAQTWHLRKNGRRWPTARRGGAAVAGRFPESHGLAFRDIQEIQWYVRQVSRVISFTGGGPGFIRASTRWGPMPRLAKGYRGWGVAPDKILQRAEWHGGGAFDFGVFLAFRRWKGYRQGRLGFTVMLASGGGDQLGRSGFRGRYHFGLCGSVSGQRHV